MASMTDDIELGVVESNQSRTKYNPFHPENNPGRPSVIYDYCATKPEDARCIWICFRKRGKWIAKDIPILVDEAQILEVYKLRQIYGWWKRHSLYSATGVKEVMIRFIDYDAAKSEVGVALAEFDYEKRKKELDSLIRAERDVQVKHFGACGVNHLGISHASDEPCVNRTADEYGEMYCPVLCWRQLCIERENLPFIPSQLDYFWQKGIAEDGLKFLESTQFITRYKSVKSDRFTDAANPYGKTVFAFRLVEGWRVRYLLCLVAISLACSLGIIGIVTAADGSIEDGVTAGSYALGLAAVFLAVMTFLSAIL